MSDSYLRPPSITRSLAQKPACKDLNRNGQRPTITLQAAYTPVPKRAGSRSQKNPPITLKS
ncbi:acetyltransferase [Lactobacillus sp. DS1_6]|nr:acetyltransferase [Lacticaseibacillus paracasei]PTS44044.1 acetyltransferase [Lactobacillus sp. DS1_6]PTS48632.1 acetyltransferase [Lactobacillus sp. DS2_6]PTV37823.1 acetyltransferase [Lactobacillus sp. DS13_6]MCT3338951.1 acetyltransferase [Lacticaseibacillus paracasei]